MVKSTWPGVSIMLITLSFQWQVVQAEVMGNAALLFLGHKVHCGRALVDLAHAVDFPRVEENALRKRGLACVNVGDDADVAQL